MVWTSTPEGKFFVSSPSISGAPGDQVILLGNSTGGEYGFTLSSGQLVFSADTRHGVSSSTAVADGRMFFGDGTGVVYAYVPT